MNNKYKTIMRDNLGNVTETGYENGRKYEKKYDRNGNIISTSYSDLNKTTKKDYQTGNITYYENGKPLYTVDKNGNKVEEYYYSSSGELVNKKNNNIINSSQTNDIFFEDDSIDIALNKIKTISDMAISVAKNIANIESSYNGKSTGNISKSVSRNVEDINLVATMITKSITTYQKSDEELMNKCKKINNKITMR